MRIVLPKTLVDESQLVGAVFFLAGPIKGGGDWQRIACKYFARSGEEITLAVPRRWSNDDPLNKHFLSGEADAFERQTLWERHYLQIAARSGGIIFWLPEESKERPREDNQPYARDTGGELGYWRAMAAKDKEVRLFVGAEPEFPGLSVITCNFTEDLGDEFYLYTTLEKLLQAALKAVG